MSRAGTILRVDLTEGKIEKQPTSTYVRDYIGGVGIGAKIIWDEVPPEVPPYDPRNLLTFNAGPLTGTLLGNKCEVMSKAPGNLNKTLVISGMGGQFGSEMKFAGYDNIIIKGKADRPVYLFIDNDNVEIRDAKHLWGLDTYETQERLGEEMNDPAVQIACIGPAGENMCAFGVIMHSIQWAAHLGGLGAVMGSKNLKAIAVRGTKGLKIADPEAFIALWKEYWKSLTEGRNALFVSLLAREGLGGHFDHFTWRNSQQWGIGGRFILPPVKKEDTIVEFVKKYKVGNIGCSFCPVQCVQNLSVPGIGASSANCGAYMMFRFDIKNVDNKLWWKALREIRRYGISTDTILLYGWLMRLYEDGLITAADTDGVPMEWGSEEAVMTIIEKIAKQEGIGKIFVDGYSSALMALGKDAANLIDLPPFVGEPWIGGFTDSFLPIRENQTIWIEPATLDLDPTIAWYGDELGKPYEEVEKMLKERASDYAEKTTGDRDAWMGDSDHVAQYIAAMNNTIHACDIVGHCDWQSDKVHLYGPGQGVEDIAKWLTAATGTKYSTEMLLDGAQRERLLGMSYAILCERAFAEKLPFMKMPEPWKDGIYKDVKLDPSKLFEVATQYYELRGCDSSGVPTRKELERLGLKDVADKLEKSD